MKGKIMRGMERYGYECIVCERGHIEFEFDGGRKLVFTSWKELINWYNKVMD